MTVTEFFETLKDGEKTMLHFSAAWCTPCRLMEPSLQQFLKENSDIKYVKIDVDDPNQMDMRNEFAIKSVPTIIAFSGRTRIQTRNSALNKTQLESLWNIYD